MVFFVLFSTGIFAGTPEVRCLRLSQSEKRSGLLQPDRQPQSYSLSQPPARGREGFLLRAIRWASCPRPPLSLGVVSTFEPSASASTEFLECFSCEAAVKPTGRSPVPQRKLIVPTVVRAISYHNARPRDVATSRLHPPLRARLPQD